ncbi:phage holin family protein [Haemophilus parahaemolyticus]|uniref:phage holin family protein n=1 Tax=Haemophilus parahaemolyticus TaxID=735 RepID=UPI001CAE9D97|nr:phage holin family protein [Haemophilus parahaemolyticus]MBF1221558.1 phage holin family protein [Haemophilus influenzae]
MMPEKQPDVYNIIWASICQYVAQNQMLITGMLVAGVLSFARVMSDGKKDTVWGVIFEVLTCTFFVGAMFDLLDDFGIQQDWYRALAVAIGVYGTILVRKFSNYFIKRFGGEDENQ